MTYIEALILSFVEGLTEFLPISSTGHLILTSAAFGIQEEGFVKAFNIIIQFGAIAAVLVIYWRRFLPKKENFNFYTKVAVSFVPAAVLGLLVKKKIDVLLGSVEVVALSLFVGGFILIWSDRFFKEDSSKKAKCNIETLSYVQCVLIGLIQCLAFIPGVSRAAATILAGLGMGLNRKEATEFSFFLAVPTLTGASLVKSLSIIKDLNSSQVGILAFGTLLSFVFAVAAIRIFINIVSKYGFKHFGIYRIILALFVFAISFRGR